MSSGPLEWPAESYPYMALGLVEQANPNDCLDQPGC